MDSNCFFCTALKGKFPKGQRRIFLNKTKNTASVLSIDIPSQKTPHVLVITKKHYMSLIQVPKPILHELIEHVQLVTRIVEKEYGACNILLNNGKHAGQEVHHVHFHIIPRKRGDHIEMEGWKHHVASQSMLLRFSKALRKKFK